VLADTIALDQNLFGTPVSDMSKTKILLTLVCGEIVFKIEENVEDAVEHKEIVNAIFFSLTEPQ
jgi:hypothetical protein